MQFIRLNTALTDNEESWTFVGVPGWKQDQEGVIYPPVWSYPNFDPDPSQVPNHYAHELAREDFAFLSSVPLADTDVTVEHKCPYGSVIHGGIVFRAVDSSRFYALDMADLGRKGQAYELSLWVQDGSGCRKELARGLAPHSVVPDGIVQTGAKTRQEWYQSSPDWIRVRVQASGTLIRVSADGRIIFELRDSTYPVGCVGLVGRGAVTFRNLKVEGTPGELPGAWTKHEGELPRFFYPGGEQSEGFNAFPMVCHTEGGVTLVAWSHAPMSADPWTTMYVVLTRSEDEGHTWSKPVHLFRRDGHSCGCASLFAHRDGSISALVGAKPAGEGPEDAISQMSVIRSSDGGRTWSDAKEFQVAGKPFSDCQKKHSQLGLYSPMIRISDGTVLMCGYEGDTVPGGTPGSNADRLDRSLLFRSRDDGHTWDEPIYFDKNNFDHNECMVAEAKAGRLVAFMRTLRATYMWTSNSEDGGQTWTPLVQSNVSAECPYLMRHSSGALILGSRGFGTFLRLSFDQGRTWSRTYRISPASAMMGMAEMNDGRIMLVMHEGYRRPGHIRAQVFRVAPDGPQVE